MIPPKKQKPKLQQEAENIRSLNDEPVESAAFAQNEAEKDIEKDPDFSLHSPNDDLDEGETARLGEDTDLV